MNIFHLIPAFTNRMVRQFFTFIIIIISILIALMQTNIAHQDYSTKPIYGVVNRDSGTISETIIDKLKQRDNAVIVVTDMATAMDQLDNHKYEAVIVFSEAFSQKIEQGDFKKTLDLYAYATTYGTTMLENDLVFFVMQSWAKQFFVLEVKKYLNAYGFAATDSEIEALKRGLAEVQDAEGVVTIKINYLDVKPLSVREANKVNTIHALNWYLTFSTFYLFVSGVWFIDIQSQSLRLALKQRRISEWKVYFSISLSIVTICLAGLLLTGGLAAMLFNESVLTFIKFLPHYTLYYFAMTGVMIFITAFFNYPATLLIIAPVFSFLNVILCGLLYDLPKWAHNINVLAHALPGAWLADILSGKTKTPFYLLLISISYFALGVLITKTVRRNDVKNS